MFERVDGIQMENPGLYQPQERLTHSGVGGRLSGERRRRRGARPAAVPIRDDLSPQELRALARRERDGRVGARLHALAHALDGRSRAEAARLAGIWIGRP